LAPALLTLPAPVKLPKKELLTKRVFNTSFRITINTKQPTQGNPWMATPSRQPATVHIYSVDLE